MNMGSAERITGVAELAGGNQSPRCADLIAAYPWSDTAIGAQVDWPEALKVAVALMLGTVSPVAIMVGRATTLLYNDAYAQIAGSRHPAALGSRATDSWPEIAEFNMRVIETCLAGNGLSFRDEHLVLHRNGEPEDVWLDIDYTPLRTGDGTPIGAYATLVETTGKVRALRERLAAQEVLAAERAAIEDANERLRVAQDSGGIGTFEWLPATGLLQVSDRFCELWGLAPRAELNTAELVPLVHPDDRHRLASLRPVGDTNPLEYSEFRVALPTTGETRWLARRGEVVDSPGTGRRYFGVVFDITTRKRIEEDQKFLLHLTDRLQFARDAQDVTHSLAADLATLLGVSGMGYASIDVDLRIVVDASQRHGAIEKLLASSGLSLLTSSTVGRLVDGHTIAINDACGDLQLRPEGQALADAGVRTLLLAPLLDEERLSALLYVYGTTARNWSASELGLIKEVAERVRWANESKRSQAALGESESQFRSLVEAVPHQVWIAEPDGQLTWFNNRVYEYTGAAEGSLDGEGWASVVHPDDLPAAAGLWAAALRDGTVYETEFRLRQGGSEKWRWFLARAVPVHDNHGGIVRWLGTNTDVHAQRTAAAELASMNAALEQRVEERTRDRERMWRLSTDLMLVADGDGRIGTVNPAWLMLLGWPNDQVSQRRLIDFAHADDRSQLELAMAPLGARGGVARFEGRFMHIDG
jgi:PAS domain S-box-containing protein